MARPRRLDGFDYTGPHRYFLTFCTRDRNRHFIDKPQVDLVLDQILYTSRGQEMEVSAYCFMPDHVHMLASGMSERADLRAFASLARQRAAWRFKRTFGLPLWQAGYYEKVLREDQGTEDTVRYIVANPVRAGLVEDVKDYPFWGSETHSREELLEFLGSDAVGRALSPARS